VYLAPGIESWGGYSDKSGSRRDVGRHKFDRICAHFRELSRYVPALQANFIVGTDTDCGDEPVHLTSEFIQQFAGVFPALGVPIAYGATPLRELLRREGRLIPLPPIFFANPMLTARAKHYNTLELVTNLVKLIAISVSWPLALRRFRSNASFAAKAVCTLRTFDLMGYLPELQRFRDLLAVDREFRNFHEGENDTVPEYYHAQLDRRLGNLAALVPREERLPVLG
jgi:hypothetical protein